MTRLVSTYNQVGGGGINNQKMAIMGAIINAHEKDIPFSIPFISEMDQVNHNYEKYDFESIFYTEGIMNFLSKYSIKLISYDENCKFDCSYEDFFWKTYRILEENPFSHDGYFRGMFTDLINSFIPKVSRSPILKRIQESIVNRMGKTVFCQFRIENDWLRHCENELGKVSAPCEDLYVNYNMILYKIKNTFPDINNVFVCADESAMPISKNRIKEFSLKKFGIYSIFKSDLIGEHENETMRPNEKSLLDMELCINKEYFIGNSKSTFSNMVSLQRYCRHGIDDRDYIYNHRSRFLRKRADHGTSVSVEKTIPFCGGEGIFLKDVLLFPSDQGRQSRCLFFRKGDNILLQDVQEQDNEYILSGLSLNGETPLSGIFSIERDSFLNLGQVRT